LTAARRLAISDDPRARDAVAKAQDEQRLGFGAVIPVGRTLGIVPQNRAKLRTDVEAELGPDEPTNVVLMNGPLPIVATPTRLITAGTAAWTERYVPVAAASPVELELDAGEVHVWAIDLGTDPGALVHLLSAAEADRAGRYRFERHRRRFVMSRAWQRLILASYGTGAAVDLNFVEGANGKPRLAGSLPRAVEFNASRSGDLALLAVAAGVPVGVDVERMDEMADMAHVARDHFSASEYDELMALPVAQCREAFYACWTRKEAYLKAVGDGLAAPLDGFDVTLRPEEPSGIRSIRGSPAEAARWSLTGLAPRDRYIGALAYRDAQLRVSLWRAAQSEPGWPRGRVANPGETAR
jgi:4'-phosphopantetheinyl transferase